MRVESSYQQEAKLVDTLSPHERRRVALAAHAADRRVLRTYREPERVRESTRLRVREAALLLGLPPPPDPAPERAKYAGGST